MSKIDDKQKARLVKHGFQKGQPSANPGGRPKMDPDLKAAFRGHGPEALETLVATLRKADARDADKIRAAEVILNPGWGMPTQQVEVDINQTLSITSALEQMRALAQRDEPPVIEAQVVAVEDTKPKD